MGYEKHRNIIAHFHPDNVLCDEHCCVKYQALPGMLEELDKFFGRYDDELSCVGVSIPNSVLQAVVVLYLLSENINFFLAAAYSDTNRHFPGFCNWILTGVPGNTNDRHITASLSLLAN